MIKVGDRVRVTNELSCHFGKEYTIRTIDSSLSGKGSAMFELEDDAQYRLGWYWPWELEKMEVV